MFICHKNKYFSSYKAEQFQIEMVKIISRRIHRIRVIVIS